MNTSRTNTFSVLFWIHRQRANASGEMPIFMRVTVNGKRAEISLQRYISENDWSVKAQRIKPKANHSIVINNYIDMARGKLPSIYNQLTSSGGEITAFNLKGIFTGKDRLTAKNGQFYFNLIASNGQVIGTSGMYVSTSGMENGIASVMTNALVAEIKE